MSQADRLAVIARLFEDGRSVSSKSLQDRFEVSRATIMRDIDFLRYRNGMLIEYQSESRNFRLTPATGTEDDVVALPGIWLTTDEAYALLTLFNLAEQLDPGLFYQFLSPLRPPLKRVLAHAGHTMMGFDRKVRVEAPIGGSLATNEMSAIRDALLDDKPVYIDAVTESGEVFSGQCQPVAIVFTGSGWVVEVELADKRVMRFAFASVVRSSQQKISRK